MKKKQNKFWMKSRAFGVIALMTFMLAMGLTVFGFSQTLGEIEGAVISHTPEVILANAGLSEEKDVFLAVAYFDQKADECVNLYDMQANKALHQRQFEWTNCGYYNKGIEKGLVDFDLGEDYLPVARNGKLTPNRGTGDMKKWFESVEGQNASFTGSLKMNYRAEGAEFSFYQDNFYPLDGLEFSAADEVNRDGHNHLFTMNFAVPFTVLASGNESFEITADDDTFVFVGNNLAIDMGGVHGATTGKFKINDKGEVYTSVEGEDFAYSGITVEAGAGSIVRIFHADRDSAESVFKVRLTGMNLTITDTKLANRDGDGLQIAYDPTDPTYVAPLGESSVVKPDGTKGFIIMATIEGATVIVFGILMAAAIRSVVHRRLTAREAERMASQKMEQK